ncbi:MAG: response regulator, partial [Candidatus Omnitrophica bacterium]|nr:response regulator [Candidatus Omnitrophota bacterium]
DDEPMIVDSMARHLKRKGFEPLKATNSKSAMELFLEHHPDICILDIHLGYGSEMNGVEVLEKIRQHNKDVPCILLTVSSEEEDTVKKGVSLGAVHLEKPCDYEVWFAKINEISQHIQKEG